jgi:hypothetical protein
MAMLKIRNVMLDAIRARIDAAFAEGHPETGFRWGRLYLHAARATRWI